MKKFVFKLEKLKEFREQILESEKNKLAALRVQRIELETEKENMLSEISQVGNDIMEMAKVGAARAYFGNAERYIITLRQQIPVIDEKINAKDREIAQQLEVVVEKTRDVKVTEKLKEKKFEEYKAAELKAEEAFIEEFVQNSESRKHDF